MRGRLALETGGWPTISGIDKKIIQAAVGSGGTIVADKNNTLIMSDMPKSSEVNNVLQPDLEATKEQGSRRIGHGALNTLDKERIQ
jgi:hypothetical protein